MPDLPGTRGERKAAMLNYEKERIEKAFNTIERAGHRVLIKNCYEGYELKILKEALTLLLEEVDKK